MLKTAWLFTRGESSVHMELVERKGGFQLVVRGPGIASALYDFSSREQVDQFTREQERELAAEGFTLQAVAERRSGFERPRSSSSSDRRRS